MESGAVMGRPTVSVQSDDIGAGSCHSGRSTVRTTSGPDGEADGAREEQPGVPGPSGPTRPPVRR